MREFTFSGAHQVAETIVICLIQSYLPTYTRDLLRSLQILSVPERVLLNNTMQISNYCWDFLRYELRV